MTPKRKTKVAIVGFNTTRDLAPFRNPEFEIWGFNSHPQHPDKYDRWFQLHKRHQLTQQWRPALDIHLNWLQSKCEIPVYTTDIWRDVPTSQVFPKDRIEDAFPRGDYHCGSFDWLVSFAILERFKEIHVYGVNFATGGEPISARPCLEYWLGLAEGKGITTHVEGGDLFHYMHLVKSKKQYGYDWTDLVEDGQKKELLDVMAKMLGETDAINSGR